MNQKGFTSVLVIFGGVILLILILGIYFKVSKNTESVKVSTISLQTPSPTPQLQEKNSLVEYSNSESKISFKHPATWKVTKDLSEYPMIRIEGDGVTVSLYPHGNPDAKRLNVDIKKTEELLVGNEKLSFSFYTTSITKQPALWTDMSFSKNLGYKYKLLNIYLNPQNEEAGLQKVTEILASIKPL